jgi:hypothetical protein
MKHARAIACGVVAVTSVLAPPAVGRERRARVVTEPYVAAGAVAIGSVQGTNRCASTSGTYIGGACFMIHSRDTRVVIEAEDDSGRVVGGRIEVGSGIVRFCGATEKPVRLPKGAESISVILEAGACAPGGGVPTQGTLTATFPR